MTGFSRQCMQSVIERGYLMYKEFYESVIAQAETPGELRIINRFLVCDMNITGADNDYLRRLLVRRESWILFNNATKTLPEVHVYGNNN